MEQTRVYRLLEGYRDQPGARLAEIADALVRLSHLVVDCPAVKELDINPLLAGEMGVIALDARIRIEPAEIEKEGRTHDLHQALSRSMGAMGSHRRRRSHLHSPDQACRRASLWGLRLYAAA